MVRTMRELKHNEALSRAQLEELKLRKFRALVRHAQLHAPYYAQLIEERGIRVESCVPTDFPVLTKTLLMANFDSLVTDRRITKQRIADFLTGSTDPNDLFLDAYRVLHTSGTSGEVGYFVYSREDWARGMSPRGQRRASPPPGRRRGLRRLRVAFFGATGGHYAGVSIMSSAQRGIARLFVKARAYEVNTPLPETLAQLNGFQPDFLSGYTNALKVLAEKQREGSLRIAPWMIAATGETVTAEDMKLLREAFGAEVFSAYGCTEHLMIGASNPDGATMTLFDDQLIFEFHEDHSLITNLFNRTLPLIRYRMSDILRPVAQQPAQRHLIVENLVGRTEQAPTFVNRNGVEDFISPITIAEIFVAGIVRFQMHLITRTSFRFLVCLEPTLDEKGREAAIAAMKSRLREILVQKDLDNVTFEVEAVDELPADPRSRKFRLIVDRRSEEMKAG